MKLHSQAFLPSVLSYEIGGKEGPGLPALNLTQLEARKAWMKLQVTIMDGQSCVSLCEQFQKHLTDESWSKDETDHLFELCK